MRSISMQQEKDSLLIKGAGIIGCSSTVVSKT